MEKQTQPNEDVSTNLLPFASQWCVVAFRIMANINNNFFMKREGRDLMRLKVNNGDRWESKKVE
jgi:hypothetical protein